MDKHFKLILKDEGQDISMPRQCQSWGYRSGPSIMVHGDICEAWFASPGDGYEADWFTYRHSEDGGRTWSEERVVMTPVPNSMDWFSVCDLAVFKYGKYYYIGYTSTVFANGGGVCNNGFVARSTSPTGPFERWCGNGWGEAGPDGVRWLGKPAPVIYYDEDWHNWGAGEFSFVVKDTVLYIYYTWTSRDINGREVHETRVATADITREDWPATVTYRGVAVTRPRGSNDSYDMVYCEDLGKFIALSTDYRFSEDSMLAVYESDDGLIYRRVNEIRANTGWMLHNCGISGDEQHHIRRGDGKEEHQPQQEDEQHDNVGGGTPEQRQQRGTDGRTEDAALPEVGAAAGKEHLDDLPDLEVLNIKFGEDDRHAGAEHAHQRYLARKQRDAVAGGQQVGQVQQERSDQIGRDAENAKVPAAQRAPKILPGHKHERNAKQTQPHQQDAAGQVRGLGAALGTAGRLTAAGGRTAARGCGAPGAAAARAPGGGCALFAGGVLC